MRIAHNLIDVHSHILPGVDDGPSNMEETILMLSGAAKQGIRTIITTPHYAVGANNKSVDELVYIRNKVQEEAFQINSELKIYSGNELYYSESILEELKSGRALTLADSRYVLVEFSVRESYKRIYHGLQEFVLAGYIPILAHVERYQCLMRKEFLIKDLIEAGAYIQMNSSSLVGGIFHSEAAYYRKLVAGGYIHLIGTDCHDAKIRIPQMEDAIKAMKKCEEGFLHKLLIENPGKILENKYI
jgi:protein-tyrosine phosphatase